jgi:hypothetical protein
MADSVLFHDTCVRIGRSRAPDPPDNVSDVPRLLDTMARHNTANAAVEHAVAMESSPRLGHDQLDADIAGQDTLRPAWHLMPDISPRIERAATDPQELLKRRVALGRVDAKDFCNGIGDRACFGPVLEACAAVHLPVFIDFRRQGDLPTFDFGICERYPAIPFVIEGFGGYPLHRVVWCLKTYPNLYLSTAGYSVFNGVRFMCDTVGSNRLLYGSDWPARSMGMSQGLVLLAAIGREERAAIAAGNFEELLDRIGEDGGAA